MSNKASYCDLQNKRESLRRSSSSKLLRISRWKPLKILSYFASRRISDHIFEKFCTGNMGFLGTRWSLEGYHTSRLQSSAFVLVLSEASIMWHATQCEFLWTLGSCRAPVYAFYAWCFIISHRGSTEAALWSPFVRTNQVPLRSYPTVSDLFLHRWRGFIISIANWTEKKAQSRWNSPQRNLLGSQ
jgi:hypothetical protein